jgi:hypothetical protein
LVINLREFVTNKVFSVKVSYFVALVFFCIITPKDTWDSMFTTEIFVGVIEPVSTEVMSIYLYVRGLHSVEDVSSGEAMSEVRAICVEAV